MPETRAELVTPMIKLNELRSLQLKLLDTALILIDCVILREIFGMNLKHLS